VSLEQAQAQLDVLARRIESADSHVTKGRRLVATSLARGLDRGLERGMIILALVALVLLVACANVAAVLLAHAEARRREIGLRLALGANRAALARQFLTESALLAAAGAAVGWLLAVWLIGAAPALAPPSSVPLHYDFRIDLRLLLFTAVSALATLLISAFAPLAYSTRVSLGEMISRAHTAGRSGRSILRYALVNGQVALSVVLVGGAIALLASLGDAHRIYPGYDTSRPLALIEASSNGEAGFRPEYLLYQEAADRIASVGGVEAVTWSRHLPLVGSGSGAALPVTPEGAPPDAVPSRIYFNLVGPKYFETIGARLTSGRVFADSDHSAAAPFAILNAEGARRFWPGQNPLGKTLRIRGDVYQVVGIAADGRIRSLHERPRPALYLPSSRMSFGETILIARTRTDPAPIVKDLARAAAGTLGLRIYDATTLRTLVKEALHQDWAPTVLGGSLAIIGLLLAAMGLYGAVAYITERRRAEFGVRVAVGARPPQVATLVLRRATLLCLTGIPCGAGLFVILYRRYIVQFTHGRPVDPTIICVSAAITLAAVLAGAVLPAVRAARLDPVQVLRAE
jgi:predicted permease